MKLLIPNKFQHLNTVFIMLKLCRPQKTLRKSLNSCTLKSLIDFCCNIQSSIAWPILFQFSLLLSFSQANAYSEYFYQADKGEIVLTPTLSYLAGAAHKKTLATGLTPEEIRKSNITTTAIQAGAEYGLSDFLSAGLLLRYDDSKKNYTAPLKELVARSGLNDLRFYLNSVYPFSSFKLRYGTSLIISPEPQKIDATGNPSNLFSGGHLLVPYLGFEYKVNSSWLAGARLDTNILLGNRVTEVNGDRSESKGGEITKIGIYSEYFMNQWHIGTSLSLSWVKDALWTSNPSSVTTNNLDNLNWNFYLPLSLSGQLTLLPQVSYVTVIEKNLGPEDIVSYESLVGQLSLRLIF